MDEQYSSGSNISCWTDTVEPPAYNSLNENIDADVVIVGAGIAGLSVAYHLIRSGKSVVVVEDGFVGSGETGRTTAHLSNAIDDRYYEVERLFGEEGAKLAAESHTKAIDSIEKIVTEENILCDFRRVSGYLFLGPDDNEDSLKKEFEAAQKAGLNVRWLESIPYIGDAQGPCIEFRNQAQFHPMKYLKAIAEAIIKKGGRIYTQTRAKEIDGTGIETEAGFKVNAKSIVVATNTPVNNKFVMHLKQYPYRSYVIGATIERGQLPYALWWDTGDHSIDKDIAPYHYIRLQEYNDEYDLLIVGGEDHPTGMPEAFDTSENIAYSKLEGWAKSHFPIVEIRYIWSGQVYEPIDALAFIGKNPMDKNNVFIVTGDSGNGMTHGAMAGLILTDLINEKENRWAKIYSPSRTNFLKSGSLYLKQFFGGLMEYFKHIPKDSDSVRIDSIQPGQANIIELDKEKYGAYRDENGELHIVSATCTHLQCQVRWNRDEKSWDCPCHGSRFSYQGKVMTGPAKEDLMYISEKSTVNS